MHIKSIILDGFKSYGRRTEIQGFDKEFNAITGLNGTGKSNILDSICFVLGISNLGQVRAATLQDLVYKSGQAGVTQANVTIVFDNRDKRQCPLGFEQNDEISVTRQVVVGGKNKYLINGRNVQNKRVQDLFCSVQLNINNPNFIIMQGRITKVLNMKPHEILSLVEEASGTNVWQVKRDQSVKLMEKKDAKLKELDDVIQEEVQPKLDKLREEKSKYLEYQKVCREIEFLSRIFYSHQYLLVLKVSDGNKIKLDAVTAAIEQCKDRILTNEQTTQELKSKIAELTAKLEEDSGDDLKGKEQRLSELVKEDSVLTGKKKALANKIEAEKKKMTHLKKSIDVDKKLLDTKNNQLGSKDGQFKQMEEQNEKLQKDYEAAQNRVEAITAGVSTTADGQSVTLQEQLMNSKQLVSTSTTTIRDCQTEIKQLTKLVKEKQNEKRSADSNYENDQNLIKNLEKDINKWTNSLRQIKYKDGTLEELQNRRISLSGELQTMRRHLDQKRADRYDFHYRDPEPNFNRRRVKGRLCNLFKVKDKRFCLALGVVAGGNLYSVVTDTDTTSKLVLQKGDLQSRTTMMPLNKIQGWSLPPAKVNLAERIAGKDNVFHALSLLEYDHDLEPAMKFAFGHTFICRDINAAKQVCFHRDIMARCVTFDGDVVDPSGSLSGGAAPQGGAILLDIAEIKELKSAYNAKNAELEDVEGQMGRLQKVAGEFNNIKQQLEMCQHELKAVNSRLANSTFQVQQSEISEMKNKIETLENNLKEAQEVCQKEKENIKTLEAQLADAKGYRERQLKQAQKDLADLKKKFTESSQMFKKKKEEYDVMTLEIEQLTTSVETANTQLETLEKEITDMESNLEEFSGTGTDLAEQIAALKQEVKSIKDHISSQNREITSKGHQINKLTKECQELQLEIKKKESELSKVKNEGKDAENTKVSLERKFPWIMEDKEFFGAKNTKYDYNQEDPKTAEKKLQVMMEKKEKMSRSINEKAMMLLEREEEEFKMVLKQRELIVNDKNIIMQTMTEVDDKKKKAVKKACQEVGDNFSGIFSSILPGAEAKLAPVGGDYLKGLEVKVGFNGMWKEGLTELSGGQRSLVALSLILAMLKYNPAPIYILDEVDAALDLSHTQNIGNMLKEHFKKSQFIIVSLKDGMFNNANVLFRTKFEDGMSAVVRTVNRANKK
ncbi:Structural maintenance of chromosomes protein [Sergentomyia squamirostris]